MVQLCPTSLFKSTNLLTKITILPYHFSCVTTEMYDKICACMYTGRGGSGGTCTKHVHLQKVKTRKQLPPYLNASCPLSTREYRLTTGDRQWNNMQRITSQARMSNLYDRKMTNKLDKHLHTLLVWTSKHLSGNLFVYARRYTKYICMLRSSKPTRCIAVIKTCLEGGVLNSIEWG